MYKEDSKLSRTKTKRINIYLTKEERKSLTQTKYYYHLSISTIANIIVDNLDEFKKYEQVFIYNDAKRDSQTSIKPRIPGSNILIKNPLYLYTNVLKLWVNKDYVKKGFMTEKQFHKFYKAVIHEFETRKEDNWDGNEWNRKLPRHLKRNKEYYKKILEDM